VSPAEWGASDPADQPRSPGEPVAWAEVVRLGFAALAAAGWVVVPSDTVNIIISAAAAIISIVATVLARRRVTPVRKEG